eukprot:jgi/Bigna1/87161/estExt_fgenesh1_pg.C_170103
MLGVAVVFADACLPTERYPTFSPESKGPILGAVGNLNKPQSERFILPPIMNPNLYPKIMGRHVEPVRECYEKDTYDDEDDDEDDDGGVKMSQVEAENKMAKALVEGQLRRQLAEKCGLQEEEVAGWESGAAQPDPVTFNIFQRHLSTKLPLPEYPDLYQVQESWDDDDGGKEETKTMAKEQAKNSKTTNATTSNTQQNVDTKAEKADVPDDDEEIKKEVDVPDFMQASNMVKRLLIEGEHVEKEVAIGDYKKSNVEDMDMGETASAVQDETRHTTNVVGSRPDPRLHKDIQYTQEEKFVDEKSDRARKVREMANDIISGR